MSVGAHYQKIGPLVLGIGQLGAAAATAGKGAVVITGSPSGMSGCTPGSTAYSSSKGGVHGVSRVMAIDYAQDGIRVNVVVPGFTLTPIVRELRAGRASGSQS